MERQFLNTFFLLFILVGCQQVKINPIDTALNEGNLYSSEENVLSNDIDISIWKYIQNNNVTSDVNVSGLMPGSYLIVVEDLGFPGGCASPIYLEISLPSDCTGCTYDVACNYDAFATLDDGSCNFSCFMDTVYIETFITEIVTEYIDCDTGLPCSSGMAEIIEKSKTNGKIYNLLGQEIIRREGIYIEGGEIKYRF